MLLRIQHETKLSYSDAVTETVFEVRMAPPSDEDQTNLGYRLRIIPAAPVTIYRDGFGNRVDLFNILTSYNELVIRATSIVRTHRGPSPESRLAGVEWGPESAGFLALETLEYLQPSPLVKRTAELDEFIAGMPRGGDRLIGVVQHVTEAVKSRLIYEKKVTTARTPVGEALRLGRGVCQDFAHLFLGACRGIGLPARYVSGYIHQPGEVRRSGPAVAAGSMSTRPVALSSATTTSRSRSAATIPTFRPTEASGKGGPTRPSP
jgi:transglutaminase-like putative cysteine protease